MKTHKCKWHRAGECYVPYGIGCQYSTNTGCKLEQPIGYTSQGTIDKEEPTK